MFCNVHEGILPVLWFSIGAWATPGLNSNQSLLRRPWRHFAMSSSPIVKRSSSQAEFSENLLQWLRPIAQTKGLSLRNFQSDWQNGYANYEHFHLNITSAILFYCISLVCMKVWTRGLVNGALVLPTVNGSSLLAPTAVSLQSYLPIRSFVTFYIFFGHLKPT